MLAPVPVKRNTPFARAFALQDSSSNSSPAPDFDLFKLVSPGVFFSRGVFLFTDTGVSVCISVRTSISIDTRFSVDTSVGTSVGISII